MSRHSAILFSLNKRGVELKMEFVGGVHAGKLRRINAAVWIALSPLIFAWWQRTTVDVKVQVAKFIILG